MSRPVNPSYPANGRGAPLYAKLGPCACQVCREPLWYAHGVTRDGWDGPVIKGLLKWRERTGRVHTHKSRKARLGYKAA